MAAVDRYFHGQAANERLLYERFATAADAIKEVADFQLVYEENSRDDWERTDIQFTFRHRRVLVEAPTYDTDKLDARARVHLFRDGVTAETIEGPGFNSFGDLLGFDATRARQEEEHDRAWNECTSDTVYARQLGAWLEQAAGTNAFVVR